MDGDAGLFGAVAEGDDSEDSLGGGDGEEGAEVIGLAHAHDEGVEAHGAGFEDEVGVAESVVVGAPEVSGGVDGGAAEETGLSGLEGGDNEDGGVGDALFIAADELQDGIPLFFADGYVVLAGLLVGPGGSILGGKEQLADLVLGNGFSRLVGADTATGGEDFVQGGRRYFAAGATDHQQSCHEATKR